MVKCVDRNKVEKINGDLSEMREQVTLKFFGMSEKVYKHLMYSADACKPCSSCTIGPDGSHLPGKAKDESGKCAMCHGSYIVPDVAQRNWAAEEILPLITQAKPIEMKVDSEGKLNELEAIYKGLPDDVLKKLLTVVSVPGVVDVKAIDRHAESSAEAGSSASGDVQKGSNLLD